MGQPPPIEGSAPSAEPESRTQSVPGGAAPREAPEPRRPPAVSPRGGARLRASREGGEPGFGGAGRRGAARPGWARSGARRREEAGAVHGPAELRAPPRRRAERWATRRTRRWQVAGGCGASRSWRRRGRAGGARRGGAALGPRRSRSEPGRSRADAPRVVRWARSGDARAAGYGFARMRAGGAAKRSCSRCSASDPCLPGGSCQRLSASFLPFLLLLLPLLLTQLCNAGSHQLLAVARGKPLESSSEMLVACPACNLLF